MAFKDALTDSITIYSISIGKKAGDLVGQEVKTETLLYNSIPGRLHSEVKSSSVNRAEPGKQEAYSYKWTLLTQPEHNGANRGDKAVVNGVNYIISYKQEISGVNASINHVVYYLEEAK